MQQFTFLTTDELAVFIKYSPRYIRRHLIDNKLIEGTHYFRPFNGRKILFIWERIQEEMFGVMDMNVPLASGGKVHG